MAINVQYLEKKGLEPYDLMVMELIAQNASEDMLDILLLYVNDECLKRLLAFEIITTVKKKRKADHDFTVMRLSKKGKTILLDGRKTGYTEEDAQLFEYLEQLYNSVEKKIGNPERVKELIAWFRVEGQFSRKQIYRAIQYYMRVQEDQDHGKYIASLENLIWKADNLFSTKWKLAGSRLYQFINENKDQLNANTSGKN